MPKKPMDYSRSCIYQVCCKDPDIKDIYVGSTTDLVKRRYNHKGACNNPNRDNHNALVYQFIRANGGWENWDVVQIERVVCDSSQDLCQREREVFETLKPTLNVNRPKVSQEETKERGMATTKVWREANHERFRARAKAWREANPERKKAAERAWNSERVVCDHCDKEVSQGALKKHYTSKKCLAAQAAQAEYQRINQEYVNERKEITADLDLD